MTATSPPTATVATPGLERFPFPFAEDTYRYSTNVEPARTALVTETGRWGDTILDVDAHYEADLAERARILAADPSRHASSPHMQAAEWDALTYCLGRLSEEWPGMSLDWSGDELRWRNRRLGVDVDARVGDAATLPGGPLAFLATQVQEDIALMDQREGALWLDAGIVTFAADWSLAFDAGMRFLEIHGPVPRIHEENVIARAEQFMMRLQPGEAYRRTNWSMTIGRRLDTATETYPVWGPDRTSVLDDPGLPEAVHLRVEVQHLVRLPSSGAILFLIRSYLEPVARLARVPAWRRRLGRVLRELPEDMAAYKGIDRYRHRVADYLLDTGR